MLIKLTEMIMYQGKRYYKNEILDVKKALADDLFYREKAVLSEQKQAEKPKENKKTEPKQKQAEKSEQIEKTEQAEDLNFEELKQMAEELEIPIPEKITPEALHKLIEDHLKNE